MSRFFHPEPVYISSLHLICMSEYRATVKNRKRGPSPAQRAQMIKAVLAKLQAGGNLRCASGASAAQVRGWVAGALDQWARTGNPEYVPPNEKRADDEKKE